MEIHTGYTTEELKRKVQELTILYEISKALGTSLQISEALEATLDIMVTHGDMKAGIMVLLDPDTKRPYMEFTRGLSTREGRCILEAKHEILEKITRIDSPLIGYKKDGLIRIYTGIDAPVREISFLGVPLKDQNETMGMIVVNKLYKDRTIKDEIELLTAIAFNISRRIGIFKKLEEERRELFKERLALQRESKVSYRFSNIIYQSEKMKEVLDLAWRVSQSKATVLLRGESGTGKELIARAIHYHSSRCDKPFISVNCAAIPDTLIESELFGHERGAFTGATQMRRGKFELAHGGTLFLDEIGDIPLSTQVKLLRVLQEKKFERVGGTKSISVDVRIIAATNKNLEEAVRRGEFREDLYYRLNVVPIYIPPLRERKEDIPPLVGHFLQIYNEENGRNIKISTEALDTLLMYDWPGNVRELQNCVERMIVMAKGDIIMAEDVPIDIDVNLSSFLTTSRPPEKKEEKRKSLDRTLEEIEKEKILEALKKCGFVQAKAARQLGITPRQIGYKIKKYNIPIEKI